MMNKSNIALVMVVFRFKINETLVATAQEKLKNQCNSATSYKQSTIVICLETNKTKTSGTSVFMVSDQDF
jgi:hypothetical protein